MNFTRESALKFMQITVADVLFVLFVLSKRKENNNKTLSISSERR